MPQTTFCARVRSAEVNQLGSKLNRNMYRNMIRTKTVKAGHGPPAGQIAHCFRQWQAEERGAQLFEVHSSDGGSAYVLQHKSTFMPAGPSSDRIRWPSAGSCRHCARGSGCHVAWPMPADRSSCQVVVTKGFQGPCIATCQTMISRDSKWLMIQGIQVHELRHSETAAVLGMQQSVNCGAMACCAAVHSLGGSARGGGLTHRRCHGTV